MTITDATADLETAVARIRRLTAILRELTEIGLQMARALRDERASGLDAVTRYTRIARAIRRLIALEAKLYQALDDVAAGRWTQEAAARDLRLLALHVEEDEAIEAVEETLAEVGDGETAHRIRERLCDWLDLRSVETDFAKAPAAEIIGRASLDIGVIPDPALMADPALHLTPAETVDLYASALAAHAVFPPPLAGAGDREAVVGAAAPKAAPESSRSSTAIDDGASDIAKFARCRAPTTAEFILGRALSATRGRSPAPVVFATGAEGT